MALFSRLPIAFALSVCLSSTGYSLGLFEFAENYQDPTGTVSTLSIQVNAHPHEAVIEEALAIAPAPEGPIPSEQEREELLRELDKLTEKNQASKKVYEAIVPFYKKRNPNDQVNILLLLLGVHYENQRKELFFCVEEDESGSSIASKLETLRKNETVKDETSSTTSSDKKHNPKKH